MKRPFEQNIFADLREEEKILKAKIPAKSRIFSSSPWLVSHLISSNDQTVITETSKDHESAPLEESGKISTRELDSEKAQILKSMEKYVVEQAPSVEFEGGKAVALANPNQFSLNFEKELPHHLGEIGEIPMGWNLEPKIPVAFVGEKPKDWNDEAPGQDILSKMIKAMGFSIKEVAILFLPKEDETNTQELLHRELAFYQTKWVISLGARAASLLIGRKERLNQIHGKIMEVEAIHGASSHQFELLPIFHPDYLQINPSMKKTAWEDLQVIMKRIS